MLLEFWVGRLRPVERRVDGSIGPHPCDLERSSLRAAALHERLVHDAHVQILQRRRGLLNGPGGPDAGHGDRPAAKLAVPASWPSAGPVRDMTGRVLSGRAAGWVAEARATRYPRARSNPAGTYMNRSMSDG